MLVRLSACSVVQLLCKVDIACLGRAAVMRVVGTGFVVSRGRERLFILVVVVAANVGHFPLNPCP